MGGSVESSSAMTMEGRNVAKASAPRAGRRSAPEKRRRYYEQNIERETQFSKAYRQNNRASCLAYQRHYRENNRVKCQEYARKYRAANKDKIAKARNEFRTVMRQQATP